MEAYNLLFPILSSYITLIIIVFRQTISPILLVTSLLILTFLSVVCIVCLHLSHLAFRNIYFRLDRGSFDATNYPIDDPENQASDLLSGWDQDRPWTIEPTPWEATIQESLNPPPTPKSETIREGEDQQGSTDSNYTIVS